MSPLPRLLRLRPALVVVAVVVIAAFASRVDGASPERVLFPPNKNLAAGRRIEATATCGEQHGQSIKEVYCSMAGAAPYSPHSPYSANHSRPFSDKCPAPLQGGHHCNFCESGNTKCERSARFMVDGSESWWMSPPLSRGISFHFVFIVGSQSLKKR